MPTRKTRCSIVRRDNGEGYQECLTPLAKASGIGTPTRADLARIDRKRAKKGSNDDWTHPHDPDAKITTMKDGRTHLAHKAGHAVDLETGAIVGGTVQGAHLGDTTTSEQTLPEAVGQLEAVAKVTDDAVPLDPDAHRRGHAARAPRPRRVDHGDLDRVPSTPDRHPGGLSSAAEQSTDLDAVESMALTRTRIQLEHRDLYHGLLATVRQSARIHWSPLEAAQVVATSWQRSIAHLRHSLLFLLTWSSRKAEVSMNVSLTPELEKFVDRAGCTTTPARSSARDFGC